MNRKNIFLIFMMLFIPVLSFAGIFSFQPKIRHSLAILPFENLSGEDKLQDVTLKASRMLFHDLYSSYKFRMIEMEKIGDIVGDELFTESKFDRDSYLKAVKSLGVDLILYGSLLNVKEEVKKNSRYVFVVVEARLVRLLNGEIVAMVKAEGKSKKALNKNFSTDEMIDIALEKTMRKISKTFSKSKIS